jgi:hypothetical protein
VPGLQDQCPNSHKGIPVNKVSCSKVDKEMSALITKSQSESYVSLLTKSIEQYSNEIVGLLVNYPDVKIEVQVHREDSVRLTLLYDICKGKYCCISLIGFGEEESIANNNASAG